MSSAKKGERTRANPPVFHWGQVFLLKGKNGSLGG